MVDGEVTSTTNQAPLATYVRRASNIMDERDALNEDLREIIAEAKEAGYESKILREVIREYRTDPETRAARYAILDIYRQELGLFADTPLGQAAVEREASELKDVDELVGFEREDREQPRRRRHRRTQPLDDVETAGSA